MKKHLALILALVMFFCLTGCGSSAKEPEPTATPEPTLEPTPEPTPTPIPITEIHDGDSYEIEGYGSFTVKGWNSTKKLVRGGMQKGGTGLSTDESTVLMVLTISFKNRTAEEIDPNYMTDDAYAIYDGVYNYSGRSTSWAKKLVPLSEEEVLICYLVANEVPDSDAPFIGYFMLNGNCYSYDFRSSEKNDLTSREKLAEMAETAEETCREYSTVSTKQVALELPYADDYLDEPLYMQVKFTSNAAILILPKPETGNGNLGPITAKTNVTVIAAHRGFYFFVADDGRMGWSSKDNFESRSVS